jgi:hypothetical protein
MSDEREGLLGACGGRRGDGAIWPRPMVWLEAWQLRTSASSGQASGRVTRT